EDDSAEAILEATTDLLTQIAAENRLDPQQIAGAWFTTTTDLTAEFPATAARRLGWTHVPLLCAHEMQVPSSNERSIPHCIRVMLLVNTDREAAEMRFVYLRSARNLRTTP
ncbi:MAG TPA: chorismate mutase, partial [Candidatus Dormibacteraeota bacterium]